MGSTKNAFPVSVGIGLLLFGGALYVLYGTPREVATPALRGTASVILTEEGYLPREFTIVRGTAVTFSTTRGRPHWPASNIHPNHEIYPEFDPKRSLLPEESWVFMFDRAGTFGFHDHLRAYFNGVIHVVEE